MSGNTRHIVDIFAWDRNWGGRTGNTSKQRKMASENDFEFVLTTFCCYEYGYVYCYDLLIRHNQHLFLTIWQYLAYEWWPEWKKMYLFLKNQTEKSTVVEWNEGMNI